MSQITFKGNPVQTSGHLPVAGTQAPDFRLTKGDLTDLHLHDLKGRRVVLNIFPSVDTGICAASVRAFNKEAAGLHNTTVVCVSKDLPFAFKRFCEAEGIANVETASQYKDQHFEKDYGLVMLDGPLAGLLSRAVIVLDEQGKVLYAEQVPEIVQEPDYAKALEALKA